MSKDEFIIVDDGSGDKYIIRRENEDIWDNWIGSEEWELAEYPCEYERLEGGLIIHAYSWE